MSKILRRPMFRGGRVDSRGTGITANLGYQAGGRVGLRDSFPGTAGDAYNSVLKFPFMNNQVGADVVAAANKKYPFLENETINYLSPNSIDNKTSVVDVKDETQEKVVDENGSTIEDSILDTDFDQTETVDGKIVSKPRKEFVGNEPGVDETTSTFFKGLFEPGQSAEYAAAKAKYKDGVVQGRDLEEDARLSQAAYEAAAKEKSNVPKINSDNDTADTEISAKDAVRANQELFADLLGKSDARGKDISDMLLRFSGAEGATVGEKFKEFTKLESKAGKSRTEKINETASALAIKDYIGGKRSKEQADIYKGKIDYTQKVKMDAVNVQPTDSAQEVLYKLGKKGDVKPTSDAAYKALILFKDPNAVVVRNDKVKLKDLKGEGGVKKLKKLKKGYNIIEENGNKRIVTYDGSGKLEGVNIFSIDEIWKL